MASIKTPTVLWAQRSSATSKQKVHSLGILASGIMANLSALELHLPNCQPSWNYTLNFEIHCHRDSHVFESKCEGV